MSLGLGLFGLLFLLIEGGDPDAAMAVVGGSMVAIMSALGRVVIHMARAMDRIADRAM